MRQDVFTKYSVPHAVAAMAIPTVLSMLVTIIYNMADTYFVGQTGDPAQVAAVSVATPVFTFMLAFSNIFGIGGSTFISRALGAGEGEKAKEVSSFCFYALVVTALLITGVLLIGMPWILKWIGTDENTVGFAEDYIKVLAYGSVPMLLSFAYGNIVRGEGASGVAMVGMMMGTVINIIFDPIMILGMKLGVTGAALATVLGNLCAALFYLIYIAKGKTLLSVSPKCLKGVNGIFGGVFKIGIPASLNNMLMSVSSIVMNNFLVVYSTNAVAAMGIAMKANMLVIFLQMGIAMGIGPLIGFCYGAKMFDRLKRIMRFSMLCNFVLGSVLTALYFVKTEWIVERFISDPAVVSYGITMLRALMMAGPFIGIMFVFTFSFQAMGKGKESLILSAARQGLVFFPVLVVGDLFFGLEGLVYAQPLADFFCLLLSIGMFLVFLRSVKKEPLAE